MVGARPALGRGMAHRALILCVVLALGACRGRSGPPPGRAFYYWRTSFTLSATEREALAELGVDHLYVRMFDVTWNEGEQRALPVGPLTVPAGSTPPPGVTIVPVVFIRDEVLRHARPAPLAAELWAEVQRRTAALGAVPAELQIDCDWTDTTRQPYFALLRALRKAAGIPLSATIRLHQIKYRERTGVPPVERGMLMFYNMGKFSPDPDARAIFDPDAAQRYLARLDDYPLPLDLALPIWSWTVQVRDDAVVGLLQRTDPATLDAIDFLRRGADGRYTATRTTFLDGHLLREGDQLKTEVTGPEDPRAAAVLVAPHLAAGPRTVTIFDLSERNLVRHDPRSLDRVFRALR